jgi:hypothetical protein
MSLGYTGRWTHGLIAYVKCCAALRFSFFVDDDFKSVSVRSCLIIS